MKTKSLVNVGLASLLLTSPILEARGFTVTIDAGHGHETPGKRAVDDSFREWDINAKVADRLEPALRAKGIEVHRVDDVTGQTDVSLQNRLQRAINYNSDLHISIHQNAVGGEWHEATGTETYYSILGSKESQELAKQVADKMASYIHTKNRGAKATTNELFITREFTKAGIDANLYEGLFMSNQQDVAQMLTEEYANSYAQAIAESIFNTYRMQINNEEFTVRIKKDLGETLTIRNKPHFTGEMTGEVCPGEVLTIVDVQNGWGKLKSGAGWINISEKFVEEIVLN
jgi:N-acetylmuramoyl-L-alanine amidase